uniref:chromate efflux transporter n=1 Tax=Polynucleobacter sp. HIN8 TaxID=3047867 RepID=UPI0033658BFC
MPLREALAYWLKLGFISFGGPTAQIAMMHDELVEKKRWISERRFLHALNYCMLLPGPEAQQLATYLGWLMHRTWGGILAGTLFILPSLIILIALSWIYIAYGQTPVISALFFGIKSAVTAVVIMAVIRIAKKSVYNRQLILVAITSFVAIFAFNLPFPLIILSAGLYGYYLGKHQPILFSKSSNDHKTTASNAGSAIIGDHTPLPAHAGFSKIKLIRQLGAASLLWLIPIFILHALFGWGGLYTQLAWFFTKAALLTFGGAYAVLPYVYQSTVEHYQWLSAAQMMDGLALGETTPGPLIMIVAFVGFVAAYSQELWIGGSLFLMGALGAVVATWFTFLPSFLFILIGAPFIESTHGNLRFTAPLTAISAAVVGVITNLGVFFAYHLFFPQGPSNSPSLISIAICAIALFLLIRLKWGVISIIGLSGGLGLLLAPNGLLFS